jgi:hypothetical protein
LRAIEKFFILSHIIVVQRWKGLSQEEVVEVGHITHFFSKISVAIVDLNATLNVGDHILVKGPVTDFEQVVDSMQIEHQNIKSAEAGHSIGLKTVQPVREKDVVYKKL